MRTTGRALALVALLSATLAGEAAETGFYVGVDAALVMPTVDKSDGIDFFLPQGVFHVPPDSIRFDESEFGWSTTVGYRVNRYLAAEFSYLDFGSIDVAETFDLANSFPFPVEPGEFTFDFDLRVAGPMISVLGMLPISEKIEAFGRAGVLWATQELPLAPQFSLEEAEERWGLGLGLQAELGRGWSARIEYQRFEDIDGTEVSGDLRLERLLLGATYRLGSGSGAPPAIGTGAKSYKNGFYAVADLGITEPSVGESDGFLLSFSNIPGVIFHVRPSALTADDAGVGGSVALGYRINRHVAAELSYTDFGNVDVQEHYVFGPIDSPFFPPIPRIDIDVDFTSRIAGPGVSILGILPIADVFELFARAGLLFADHQVARSPGDGSASDADELFVWGTGFDVELSDRWAVRFAYENVENLRKTSYTGPIRIERFVIGVNYDF